MAKIARGERNNNPGNIRHGAKWQGLASTQTDKDFLSIYFTRIWHQSNL